MYLQVYLGKASISSFAIKIRVIHKDSSSVVLFNECYILFPHACILIREGFVRRYIFMAMYSFVPPFREATFCGVPSCMCLWYIRVCRRCKSFGNIALEEAEWSASHSAPSCTGEQRTAHRLDPVCTRCSRQKFLAVLRIKFWPSSPQPRHCTDWAKPTPRGIMRTTSSTKMKEF